MNGLERSALWCGVLGPVFSLGCVALATVLASPAEFTWASEALSELGRREASTFWLFNGGLVGGGALGAVFAWPLWRRTRNRVERLGVVSFVFTTVGLGLVGVFYLPHGLHEVVALVFFVGGPLTHWLYGTGRILARDVRVGLVSVGAGVVHVLGWTGWFVSAAVTGSTDWFAVPEMVAALAFGGWLVFLARQLLDGTGETGTIPDTPAHE